MLINALLCLADYQGLWLYTGCSFKWRVAYSILKRKKKLYLCKPQLFLRSKCFAFSAVRRKELPPITIFYHYTLRNTQLWKSKEAQKLHCLWGHNITAPIVLYESWSRFHSEILITNTGVCHLLLWLKQRLKGKPHNKHMEGVGEMSSGYRGKWNVGWRAAILTNPLELKATEN